MQKFQPFNASTVELTGSNLIEASAGTGKTYSIAILVLRLVLEKRISIKEILMVTFTKAAVAELEERIRLFVRTALRAANGARVTDSTIALIVDAAIKASSADEVVHLLQDAVLLLDETSVQTIHSFCQKTLDEFALEADMRYDAVISTDVSDIVSPQIDAYWRRHVATLPVDLLKLFLTQEKGLNKSDMLSIVTGQLSGKMFSCYDTQTDYSISPKQLDEIVAQISTADDTGLGVLSRQLTQRIYSHALSIIVPAIDMHKQQFNLLTYDDMIEKLHAALVKRNSKALATELQKKYKAVFIDEFQDTDKLQYEIFSKAFNNTGAVVFYIGDPKQSIYAWRKADIQTYFRAYHEADHLYGMNQNFRSGESMIAAMNHFFMPTVGFDTFAFGNANDAIRYIEVESPMPNTKGQFMHDGQEEAPITIYEFNNKEALLDPLGAQVASLLCNDKYVIEKNGTQRKVTPRDIGILVRTNPEAAKVKSVLARLGIPAITIGEAKVFDSAEARYLLYLLQAFDGLSQGSINKALLSPFTGFNVADILGLDVEKVAEMFRNYKEIWKNSGIYLAIKAFLSDFNGRGVLLDGENETGERTIANIYHLTELLHKAEIRKHLSPTELIGWLHGGINGTQPADDEFELRVESDEEAVTIVTIHKSKGLEYNIVLAPYLDLIVYNTFDEVSWRDTSNGVYRFGFKKWLTPDEKSQYEEQVVQENRRLLYVAITRAVYKCFIYKVNVIKGGYSTKNSALAVFVNELRGKNNSLIHFEDAFALPQGVKYRQVEKSQKPTYIEAANFKLAQLNWCKMSYSFLAAGHDKLPKPKTLNDATDYDQFVFTDLLKGAQTGNLLHYLFENVDFGNPKRWETVIDDALVQFLPRYRTQYAPMLLRLLREVFSANITIDGDTFQLSSISQDRRLKELEFDFMMPPMDMDQLNQLSSPNRMVDVRPIGPKEGVMNGKIDLFFEHNGKYYILDWKSNHLGDTLDCYTPDKLNDAMNESNYHLQYLIYTAAVNKYLKTRIPNYDYETHFGGVVYLFVRGVRIGEVTGVFVCKPDTEQLKILN